MQITVPEIVPIATEDLVILVFVVEAKGRGFPNDLAKLLIHRGRRNLPDQGCKTSIPGSNPGGASRFFKHSPLFRFRSRAKLTPSEPGWRPWR